MPEGNAFGFLQRPERETKPRSKGITVVSDRTNSVRQVESYIESIGEIVDHMKLPDHVGILWRFKPEDIKKRNALYNAAGIHTLPGGIPFEVAAVQGKVPECMKRVAELGFKGVEVSGDSIEISEKDRINAIKWGLEFGLEVFTEMGKKFPDTPLDPIEATEMAQRDLEAGAMLVVVEKTDVAIIMKNKTDVLHQVMEAVGMRNLIIECGPGDDWKVIAKWLIKEFGPDVNLENIYADEAYVIEAMRHGLNRGADYAYFHQFQGQELPAIPSPSVASTAE